MSESQLAELTDHVTALRAEMKMRLLDAFIVPRFDAHQGEYIAPHDERLGFVTGFTGSAGVAIVTQSEVRLFVDGRYVVQAGNQCPAGLIDRDHIHNHPPEHWLSDVAQPDWVIGYDAMHLPPNWVKRFEKGANAAGASLKAMSENPVDAVWGDQPDEPLGTISAFPLQFAGVSSSDKRDLFLKEMAAEDAALLVETQPDNIAWFLNVRGDDVAYNPMPQSFLLLERSGAAHWFVDQGKFEEGLADTLPDWVSLRAKSDLLESLAAKTGKGARVLVDPDFSPAAVSQRIIEAEAVPVPKLSPMTLAKARKNATELEGLRSCHIEDAVAWIEFSEWLMDAVASRAADGDPVTEFEALEKILSFRRERPGYLSESFHTISCAGPNAAMCHYAADKNNSAPILPAAPYLLDSGGQFETGTTDATRSFSFGFLPDGYAEAYTAVFKALVALATLRFPKGTQGHHIDAICRRPLWDLGLDYDHGTGHGIGHRLSVHEHPQRIGKPHNPVDLAPGMVLSIEPGYYKAGAFGIRLENLFEIREADDGFLYFDNMTWIPIQKDALIPERLSVAEINWLDAYHEQTEKLVGPRCQDGARHWLADTCRPLGRAPAPWQQAG